MAKKLKGEIVLGIAGRPRFSRVVLDKPHGEHRYAWLDERIKKEQMSKLWRYRSGAVVPGQRIEIYDVENEGGQLYALSIRKLSEGKRISRPDY